MTRLVMTASGWGRSTAEVFEKASRSLKLMNVHASVRALEWQREPGKSQKLEDLVDLRDANEVIEQAAMFVLDELEKLNYPESLTFISHSTGSLVVEELLLLLPTENGKIRDTLIQHIMLAPAVAGSAWATLGQAVRLILPSRVFGKQISSKKPLLRALIKSAPIEKLERNKLLERLDLGEKIRELAAEDEPTTESFIDALSTRFFSPKNKAVDIVRYLLIGTRDVVVRPPEHKVGKVRAFIGPYGHHGVGLLAPSSMCQVYTDEATDREYFKGALIRELVERGIQDE